MLESLLNKVAGLKPYNFIKKETLTQVFFYEFCKIFRNSYFAEHVQTPASKNHCERNG